MIEFDLQSAQNFLAQHHIENCEVKKIAGDASFRSYYRVFFDEETYILMFAPPGYEDVKPFIKIDAFLVEQGFSAPKIIAQDQALGFLLLEDLGDDTYSRILKENPSQELELYQKATDCLLALHKSTKTPKNILTYNHHLLLREVMLFIEWYLPLRKKEISQAEIAAFKRAWMKLFDHLGQLAGVLDHHKQNEALVVVLRDYHADNLIFLPNRMDEKKVGLLDFQDAVMGSRAYDLVSLLEDARRDVLPQNREKIFQYYLQHSNGDAQAFKDDYEILSLQRNIKIAGIFARLSLRDGKDHYLDFLPRVLNFIAVRLESQNPILSDISSLIKKYM